MYGAKVDELDEEETKRDFVLPLFRALNWNVEDSREVSAEENISKKRVDYGLGRGHLEVLLGSQGGQ